MIDARALKQARLVDKGDRDFDVIAGVVVIELSHDGEGDWTFWNVRVGDDRFGGTQLLSPGPFVDWLEVWKDKPSEWPLSGGQRAAA